MPAPDLLSREQFFAAGIEPDTCNICLEPFIWGHHPVRFTGADSCGHVFGATCLQKWTESQNDNANKCPTCRHLLFQNKTAFTGEEEEYEEEEGEEEEEEEEEPHIPDFDIIWDETFDTSDSMHNNSSSDDDNDNSSDSGRLLRQTQQLTHNSSEVDQVEETLRSRTRAGKTKSHSQTTWRTSRGTSTHWLSPKDSYTV